MKSASDVADMKPSTVLMQECKELEDRLCELASKLEDTVKRVTGVRERADSAMVQSAGNTPHFEGELGAAHDSNRTCIRHVEHMHFLLSHL